MADPTQRIDVIAPDGSLGTLPIADLESGSAAAAGFRVATPEDLEEARLQREFGEGVANVARAGAEGVARGLTVGLSDSLLTSLGVDPEGLAERQARNPLAAVGGEVGGAVAGALASGGLGAAARGGAVARGLAASPAGLLARAGTAVEGSAAARLGGGAAARVAGAGAGAALEGVVGGVGAAISEAELREDVELTSELLMAHAGFGAVIGGGAGAGLRGLFEAGGAAVSGTRRALKGAFGEGQQQLDAAGAARNLGAAEPPPGAAAVPEPDAPGAPAVPGAPDAPDAPDGKSVLGRVVDDARAAGELDDVHQQVVRDVERDLSSLEEGLDRVTARYVGFKPADIRKAMEASPPDPDVVVGSTTDIVERMGQRIDELLARQGEFVAERGGTPALRAMQKRLTAFAQGATNDPADLFNGLDKTKQTLGYLSANLNGRAVPGEGTPITVGDHLRGLYEDMRLMLEDPLIWGEGASGMQTRVNRAFTRMFDSSSVYNSRFLTDDIVPAANPFRDLRKADARKLAPVLRTLGRAESEFDERVLREAADARANVADVIASEYGDRAGAKELRELAARAAASIDKMKATLQSAERHHGRMDAATYVGAAAGFALGGVGGGAVGALAPRVLSLVQGATKLTKVQAAADRVLRRVATAVSSFFRATGRVATAGRRAVAAAAAERESHEAEYDRRRAPVEAWAASPQLAASRLQAQLAGVEDVAPGVSAGFAASAHRAAMFLADRLPVARPSSDLLRPDLDTQGRVSERERSRWLRYARAVEDGPEGILRAFERGELTREQGEVLRELYPALHGRIVRQVADLAAARRDPLPYRDLLSLSLLLGVPLHRSMTPESVARMQATYARQQEIPAPSGASGSTDTAKDEMTRAQQISQRGSQ